MEGYDKEYSLQISLVILLSITHTVHDGGCLLTLGWNELHGSLVASPLVINVAFQTHADKAFI